MIRATWYFPASCSSRPWWDQEFENVSIELWATVLWRRSWLLHVHSHTGVDYIALLGAREISGLVVGGCCGRIRWNRLGGGIRRIHPGYLWHFKFFLFILLHLEFGGNMEAIKKPSILESSIGCLIIHKAKILRKIHSQQLSQFKSICSWFWIFSCYQLCFPFLPLISPFHMQPNQCTEQIVFLVRRLE